MGNKNSKKGTKSAVDTPPNVNTNTDTNDDVNNETTNNDDNKSNDNNDGTNNKSSNDDNKNAFPDTTTNNNDYSIDLDNIPPWAIRRLPMNMDNDNLLKNMKSQDYLDNLVIFDVRTPKQDYLGGNIKGSTNIEHQEFMDNIDTIYPKYNKLKYVVFHCMYSQSRGPRCARFYGDYLSDKLSDLLKLRKDESTTKYDNEIKMILDQNIYILKGGFIGFLNKYINDETNKNWINNFDKQYWNMETVGNKTQLYHIDDW